MTWRTERMKKKWFFHYLSILWLFLSFIIYLSAREVTMKVQHTTKSVRLLNHKTLLNLSQKRIRNISSPWSTSTSRSSQRTSSSSRDIRLRSSFWSESWPLSRKYRMYRLTRSIASKTKKLRSWFCVSWEPANLTFWLSPTAFWPPAVERATSLWCCAAMLKCGTLSPQSSHAATSSTSVLDRWSLRQIRQRILIRRRHDSRASISSESITVRDSIPLRRESPPRRRGSAILTERTRDRDRNAGEVVEASLLRSRVSAAVEARPPSLDCCHVGSEKLLWCIIVQVLSHPTMLSSRTDFTNSLSIFSFSIRLVAIPFQSPVIPYSRFLKWYLETYLEQ